MKKIIFLLSFYLYLPFYDCAQISDPEHKYNEQVISQLIKAGDNLTKPRKVQHWIYFKSANNRKEFIIFIQKKGYNIDHFDLVKSDKFPYSLTFSKVNKVTYEAMNPVTKELKTIAKKYDGDYDGWETSVEK
jgi:regulator of RNase E activity RraB